MRALRFLLLALAAFPVFAQFEVKPAVAIKGVTRTVILRSEEGWLCNPPVWCGVSSVTIGGVQSPSVTLTNRSAELAVAVPDLPAGTVADIVVTDQEGNIRRRQAALHIVDPDAEFSPEAFDRVLIPVIYEGPGQKGSQWTTEVWLMNGNTYEMPMLHGPQLVAEQSVELDVNAPNGYILYPAQGSSDDLSINVLVRDLSRQSEALGTELPAVRERDFEDRRVLLQNIPSDPRYRLTLRAYALDRLPFTDRMNYWLYDNETGQQVAFGILALRQPLEERTPWSGSVDLMAVHPEIAGKGPLRLSISPLAPTPMGRFWAFVSVTNNETQHVTVISPNP